jgi:ABC-type transport system involved in multi-copper enzyme maturation permease subunit
MSGGHLWGRPCVGVSIFVIFSATVLLTIFLITTSTGKTQKASLMILLLILILILMVGGGSVWIYSTVANQIPPVGHRRVESLTKA